MPSNLRLEMISRTVIIRGKVQGVFFRLHTREKAISLGIVGQVRNLPDGTVQIRAEGEVGAMGTFLDWCKIGPARAQVVECIVEESSLKGFSGFDIVG